MQELGSQQIPRVVIMVYRLFHGIGTFHFTVLLSLFPIIGEMIPIIRKKPKKRPDYHFSFMY